MKKAIIPFLLLGAAFPFIAMAQSADVQKGAILTTANEKTAGGIKDLTKNKGSILFTADNGEKKTYTPEDILGFSIGSVDYISYASDFYKVIVSGSKAALYQRATDNSGKMLYNGAEPVSVTTAQGKAGDLYVKVDGKFAVVTARNFDKVAAELFAGCPAIVADIKAKQSDFTKLAAVVEKYNSCN